jgi:hypothetical protein
VTLWTHSLTCMTALQAALFTETELELLHNSPDCVRTMFVGGTFVCVCVLPMKGVACVSQDASFSEPTYVYG